MLTVASMQLLAQKNQHCKIAKIQISSKNFFCCASYKVNIFGSIWPVKPNQGLDMCTHVNQSSHHWLQGGWENAASKALYFQYKA